MGGICSNDNMVLEIRRPPREALPLILLIEQPSPPVSIKLHVEFADELSCHLRSTKLIKCSLQILAISSNCSSGHRSTGTGLGNMVKMNYRHQASKKINIKL